MRWECFKQALAMEMDPCCFWTIAFPVVTDLESMNWYRNGEIGFWWVWIAKQLCSYILSIQIPDGKSFANSYK